MEERASAGERFLSLLAYLGPLVILPVLWRLFARAPRRFVVFHTRQGLYLFSLALVLLAVLAGLFYLFNTVWPVPVLRQVLAVLVVLTFVAYLVATIILAAGTQMGKMTMCPVLGELAGEA